MLAAILLALSLILLMQVVSLPSSASLGAKAIGALAALVSLFLLIYAVAPRP
jgi:hypothetical protein